MTERIKRDINITRILNCERTTQLAQQRLIQSIDIPRNCPFSKASSVYSIYTEKVGESLRHVLICLIRGHSRRPPDSLYIKKKIIIKSRPPQQTLLIMDREKGEKRLLACFLFPPKTSAAQTGSRCWFSFSRTL